MKLIVGLGNPGKEYENTRHNVGFMVLNSFGDNFTLEKKFQAMLRKTKIGFNDVLFVKPVTFMNLSGNAVAKIVQYYDINISEILVIHDDLDLEFGRFRLKKNSSSGGHNGIKSIIQCLKTQDFCRLKIGIAHDRSIDTADYVLQKFSKSQIQDLTASFSFYQEIIEYWISNGTALTMEKYNNRGNAK